MLWRLLAVLYRTVTEIKFHRAVKRIVFASAPLPLISATVEVDAPIFQSKSGSEKRRRDDATFRGSLCGTAFAWLILTYYELYEAAQGNPKT